MRALRQEEEEDRDDQVNGEQLYALEPVALAVAANFLGNPDGGSDRNDFRED
jgi:hypothetical protein